LKARETYEHPAATILLTAHRDLEQLILSRSELRFKAMVDQTWAELVYQGLMDEPLFAALNAFIDKTQERVTGMVKLKLYKGSAWVIARSSPYALYSRELVSFDFKAIDQRAAEGFSMFHGFQARLFKQLRI
jgi:argininosuccinate synthase